MALQTGAGLGFPAREEREEEGKKEGKPGVVLSRETAWKAPH